MESKIAAYPLISVVMSTYNRASMLREALSTLIGMDPPAYEIVVVNDGSTDETGAVLETFIPSITYVNRLNAGKSSAINLAVSIARGDWIWICDDDDLVVRDAIRHFSEALLVAPGAKFVYSTIGHLIPNGSGTYTPRRLGDVDLPTPESLRFALLLGKWIPYLPSLIIRRELYLKLGGFREDLPRVEDEDFALRMTRHALGAPLDMATYLIREHDGDRGGPSSRFSNSERENFDMHHLAKIYAEVDTDYSTDDFRPPIEYSKYAGTDPIALRMTVMFRATLWHLSSRDLFLSCSTVQDQVTLSALKNNFSRIVNSFSDQKISLFFRSIFFSTLKQKKHTTTARHILAGIQRGLYWSIVRDFRKRKKMAPLFKITALLKVSGIIILTKIIHSRTDI